MNHVASTPPELDSADNLGRHDDASRATTEACDLAASLPSTERDDDLAQSFDLCARRSLGDGNFQLACDEALRALIIRRAMPMDDEPSRIRIDAGIITSLNALRRALGQLARWPEALEASLEAVRLAQEHQNAGHDTDLKGLAYNLAHLSEAYLFNERLQDARDAAEQSIESARRHCSGDAAVLARGLTALAVVLDKLGRPDEAIVAMDAAIAALTTAPHVRAFDVARAHVNRATILRATERVGEARNDVDRAIMIYKQWYGEVRRAPRLDNCS
jgi:tetratricopeptide (TPR) repeat protein